MRKVFALVFIGFSMLANAQSVDSIRKYWQENDLSRAKERVDFFVEENPEEVKGWLLKAGIYNSISNDYDYKDLVADGRQEAFNAIKKGVEVNPGWMQEQLQKDNYRLILEIYKGYTNEGVAFFNAGSEKRNKEDFAKAVPLFKKAAAVGRFIYEKGWGLTAIDSNNLFYTAKAAIQAEKNEEALIYARRIAEANIISTTEQTGFEQVYQWLVYYYRLKNDADNLEKYTATGLRNFPLSTYFELNYIDWLRSEKKYPAMFPVYKKLLSKDADNHPGYRWANCQDMFNFAFDQKDSIGSRKAILELLEKELASYTNKYPADIKAKLLAVKFYVNKASALQQEIKKTKASRKKQSIAEQTAITATLKKASLAVKDIILNYPNSDKLVYNESLQLLADILISTGKRAEAKKYQAMLKQ